MSRFNQRAGFPSGRRTVIMVGGSLVAILIGTNLLMYYNVFAPVQLPDAADMRIPAIASPRPATDGPPVGPHAVDENYRRAVTSQLTQISKEDGKSTPVPEAEKPPMPRPVAPAPGVTLAVNTVDVPLNVRAQPGTSAPVIGSLAPGTSLAAIGLNSDGSWILAHIPNLGEPGWVFAGLVQVTAGDLSTLRLVETALQQE